MAAATQPTTGDTGRIKIAKSGAPASLLGFNKWSVSPKAETKTTRSYDDEGGWEQTSEATLKMWDGNAEASFIQSEYDELFALLGRRLAAEFVTQTDADGTEYGLKGNVVITGLPISHQVGEIITTTLEFKGDSVLSQLHQAPPVGP